MTDPWWLMLVKVLGVFVFLILTVVLAIVIERKVVGRMQMRPGPNRVGPKGWLQSLADAIKLALKEDITPSTSTGRSTRWRRSSRPCRRSPHSL